MAFHFHRGFSKGKVQSVGSNNLKSQNGLFILYDGESEGRRGVAFLTSLTKCNDTFPLPPASYWLKLMNLEVIYI